jgi:hypothetical protein
MPASFLKGRRQTVGPTRSEAEFGGIGEPKRSTLPADRPPADTTGMIDFLTTDHPLPDTVLFWTMLEIGRVAQAGKIDGRRSNRNRVCCVEPGARL